jgi:ribosomal protein S6--L-glutamate ligase
VRIAVLSRSAALYSTSRLVLAGRARGHEVDVIDPFDLQMVIAPRLAALCYQARALVGYDAVVPRIGTSARHFGTGVVRLFEAESVVLNGADAITIARDKVRSLGVLAERGLDVPITVATRGLAGIDEALALVGGCPVVVKLQHGTQGVGTMLAESKKALLPMVETLQSMGQETILQQFVKGARGRDLRMVVVGGRVVATMRRRSSRGEFRSNMHRGATAEAVEPSRPYRKTAIAAARILGLEIAGVDVLETTRGPILLEVNGSPGLEGIEQICEVDVAGAIVALAERRHAQRKRRKRGKNQGRAWS